MPRLILLEKLFLSLSASDLVGAKTTAEAITDEEEQNDHRKAAGRLRRALKATPIPARPLVANGFSLEQLLTPLPNPPPLSEVVLKRETRLTLESIVKEWGRRAELHRLGIARRTKVLLFGPPGCGKSISAAALGREMGLPVFVVRLDALVGSYLGETAGRVRQLLNWASGVPCVILLDEIDAIARRRGWLSDVSEIDRVVVTLLQELEHTTPAGLLCATTNRYRDIDEALIRRFDAAISMPQPRRNDLLSYAKAACAARGMKWSPQIGRAVQATHNYADAKKAIEAIQRSLLLAP